VRKTAFWISFVIGGFAMAVRMVEIAIEVYVRTKTRAVLEP
jgi:hypothetical protein